MANETLKTKLQELEKISNPTARWKAAKQVKWVMSCPQLGLYAALSNDLGGGIIPVTSKAEAVVFTAQDNEERKLAFYRAVTGINWQPELV